MQYLTDKDTVDAILDRHEEYKGKWRQLTLDDLFDWNSLLELFMDTRTQAKSEYVEQKNTLENDVSIFKCTLRNDKDDAGKKKYTESGIDDIVAVQFKEAYTKLAIKKTLIEFMENKILTIPEYINLWKKFIW